MADPRWTDETQQVVARSLYGIRNKATIDGWADETYYDLDSESRRPWDRLASRAVEALAAAGLLLPPGGVTRQERSWSHPDGTDCINEECFDRRREVRTVTEWPDGNELITPWRAVDSDA